MKFEIFENRTRSQMSTCEENMYYISDQDTNQFLMLAKIKPQIFKILLIELTRTY